MKNIFLCGALSLALGLGFVACNDDDTYIHTDSILAEVTTGGAVTTSTTATVTGTVRDLSSMNPSRYTVGVAYATSEAALPDGGSRVTGTLGEDGVTVTTTISGLQSEQQYYYCTFVTMQGNYSEYGEVKSFLTTDRAIATVPAASVTRTTAQLGASLNNLDHLLADGAEHGIYISATPDMAAPVRMLVEGTENSFSAKATALIPNTTYHYASFITLNGEDALGDVQSFTTLPGTADIECDDYVDMGTKLEWAKCNLGAETETEAGGLYGYGDITGLKSSTRINEYASENISGTAADPAVAANAGMTPTAADWAELVAACTVTDEVRDGVKGALFTSNTTGNTLFFPYAGSRDGEETAQAGVAGHYWTGEIAESSKASYANTIRLAGGNVDNAIAQRSNGLSIRPVRKRIVKGVIPCDNDKIIAGDLENNGSYRIEIFNHYGAGTFDNPPIDINNISFSNYIAVTFKLSGVELNAGAPSGYIAALSLADGDWNPSCWGDNDKWSALVTGDGTYTVCVLATPDTPLYEGAEVFVIDIKGLSSNVADPTAIKAEIISITQDGDMPFTEMTFDTSKATFGSDEDQSARFDILNPWGAFGDYVSEFAGTKFVNGSTLNVTFTIKGIDGNLKPGAAGSYTTAIGLATGGWAAQSWRDYTHNGCCTVTGDGTYTAKVYVSGDDNGFTCLTLNMQNLYNDLVDTSKIVLESASASIVSNPTE